MSEEKSKPIKVEDALAIATSIAYTRKEVNKLNERIDSLEGSQKEIVEIVGPSGEQGPRGLPGIQGEKGDRGDPGEKGDRGERGEIGPQGISGAKGEQGYKGDKGDVGPIGPQGEQGAQGPQGERGEKGDKGDPGIDGAKGDRGEKGDKGDIGQRGEKGDRGEQGLPGKDGKSGKDGKDGAKGDKGEKGDIGPVGPQGPQGERGEKGESGADADIKPLETKFKKFTEDFDKEFTTYRNRINVAISKALATDAWKATGSGEVNLRWLDDVDRDSIEDGFVLSYNAATKKFTFVEQTGGGGGGGPAFRNVLVNNTYLVSANSSNGTLKIISGDNLLITTDTVADSLTIDVDLTGYAVNTTVNTVWSTANSAYNQANSAANTANAAYAYANTIQSFNRIDVAGQSSIVADGANDNLTIVAGNNIVITTDASTDTLIISAPLLDTINAIFADTREPMGFVERTDSVISFNNASRTFTISPAISSYYIYTKGIKRQITNSRSVSIPNSTGLYYIYFDGNGVLQYRTTFFDWDDDCMVAYVYWNQNTQTAPFVADERHGITLDWQTHEYLHRTRGAAIANGFGATNYIVNGDGSLDTHLQIDIQNGTFFDEDLQVDITHSNTPTANAWEQDLQGPARIPMFYLSNNAWVIDTPTNFPIKQGSSRPQYNLFSAGTWSTVDIDNNKFGVTFIVATNNINYPVIGIIGQDQRANIGDAEGIQFSDLILTGFPVVEMRPLYKLVYECKTNYTNSVNARLVSVWDLRSFNSITTLPATLSDHGLLTGLTDDDHPQYLLRTDANVIYDTANASYNQANLALTVAQAAYDQANTGGGSGTDNLARSIANSAYNTANLAYDFANTVSNNLTIVYSTTNSAFSTANAAWSTANAAYDYANTIPIFDQNLNTSNSVSFAELTITGNTTSENIIPASNNVYDLGSNDHRFKDLYLSGSSIYLGNTSITEAQYELLKSTANQSISIANSGFDQANTANALAQAAYNYANTIPIFDQNLNTSNSVSFTELTVTGNTNSQNVIPTSNNVYSLGKASYRFTNLYLSDSIYLGNTVITSVSYNTLSQTANNAYTQANTALAVAQAAYNQANTGGGGGGTGVIKTYNILNDFSAPLLGTQIFVPPQSTTITKVQITNGETAGVDIMLGLYKNNDLITFLTLPSGNITTTINGINHLIQTNDYITVNVVAGSGKNLMMTLFNN